MNDRAGQGRALCGQKRNAQMNGSLIGRATLAGEGSPSTRPKRRVEGGEAFQGWTVMAGSLRRAIFDGRTHVA